MNAKNYKASFVAALFFTIVYALMLNAEPGVDISESLLANFEIGTLLELAFFMAISLYIPFVLLAFISAIPRFEQLPEYATPCILWAYLAVFIALAFGLISPWEVTW